MKKKDLMKKLEELVVKAGGYRNAQKLIMSRKGAAPAHGSLNRAARIGTQEYILLCYIEDLENAVNEREINSKPEV